MSMYSEEERKASLFVECGPGLTKQAFRDECDINNIMKRFEKTGMVEHLSQGTPFYGDVSGIRSYQESLQVVQEAEDLFMKMDASVRDKFANDPAKMIAFLSDSKNLDEAIKLGMVIPRPEKAVEATPVADSVKSGK